MYTIFGPPPLSILYMLIFIKWVMWPQRPAPYPVLAAALGPLACPSLHSARPIKARGPNLTLNMYTNLLKNEK